MAHKKGLGSSRNGRDSNPQMLGVKMFAGQVVTGGEIIVRQRGSRFKAGEGVGMGKDDTLYARAAGKLDFSEGRRGRVVSVLPFELEAAAAAAADASSAVAESRPPADGIVVDEASVPAPAASPAGTDAAPAAS
jgi:large subunit ribosomal protein L27